MKNTPSHTHQSKLNTPFIINRAVQNHFVGTLQLREFGIRETRYANYRVAVGLLVGQGWEQRRPTLPKLCVSKARPKVLVFLHLNNLFGETNG